LHISQEKKTLKSCSFTKLKKEKIKSCSVALLTSFLKKQKWHKLENFENSNLFAKFDDKKKITYNHLYFVSKARTKV